MINPQTIAQAYIAVWNQTDTDQRVKLLETGWASSARYTDPLVAVTGQADIAGMIGAVQARFPGLVFGLKGVPDGHGSNVRFSWSLGPEGQESVVEGTDFVRLENGRIADVTGFLDKLPVG